MRNSRKVPLSAVAQAEENAKSEGPGPALPQLHKKMPDVLEIAPIVTFNDWVLLVPFTVETNLLLPATTDYRNIGVVVGKSETMLAPNGQRVKSGLEYGQVVLFQKRSVVGEMAIAAEPYVGRKIIIMSERNIVALLPAVPIKILDRKIGAEDFPQLQPDQD